MSTWSMRPEYICRRHICHLKMRQNCYKKATIVVKKSIHHIDMARFKVNLRKHKQKAKTNKFIDTFTEVETQK